MDDAYKNITATINTKSLIHNIQLLREMAGTEIMPALKNNAYGHGIIPISKICRKIGVKYLGVATLGEAIYLRENKDKGRICAWIINPYGSEIDKAILYNIDIAIIDVKHIDIILNRIPDGKWLNVHLFVDTGLHRLGIPYRKSVKSAIRINNNTKFKLVGLMSHLCCNSNKLESNKQLRLFDKLIFKLKRLNITPELTHIGSTHTILNGDVSKYSLNRSGGGIYGYYKHTSNLIPIMNIKSKLLTIKKIYKGDGVGYNHTYIAPKNMLIGIIPIGFSDLFLIHKVNNNIKLYVNINGSRREIIGKISMDSIIIKLKKIDKIGDDVLFFGNPNEGYISLQDTATKLGIPIGYILSQLGERVKYIYK
jgi:alanine racemase